MKDWIPPPVIGTGIIAPGLLLIRASVELILHAQQAAKKEDDENQNSGTPGRSRGPHGGTGAGLTEPLLSQETEDEETSVTYFPEQPVPKFAVFLKFLYPLISIAYVAALIVHAKHIGPLDINSHVAHLVLTALIHNTVNMSLLYSDMRGSRYGRSQRTVHALSVAFLLAALVSNLLELLSNGYSTQLLELTVVPTVLSAHVLSHLLETLCRPAAATSSSPDAVAPAVLWPMLLPYVWPAATRRGTGPFWNRVRSVSTFLCVAVAKACNLVGPLLLSKAATALAHAEYRRCATLAAYFGASQWAGKAAKEMQGLVYLRVAQAAFVQLSTRVFTHLHGLTMEWHLKKKVGDVLRSMDRGISACDTLMKYLFLWLAPALFEAIVIVIIFCYHFHYPPLAIVVYFFVYVYVTFTMLVTTWRRKFRKAVAKSDNDWHNVTMDSILNFETVKLFGAEQYEIERFENSVKDYQTKSVSVQSSLSFLNISQQFMLQACLAISLALTAYGIKRRNDCCEDLGCDGGESMDCCSSSKCPGMNLGDFIAVYSYVLQLFTPLNFLGSVYNAIVMAFIDLESLTQLLQEESEVTDVKDAMLLPPVPSNVVVKFDCVSFRYPTQPPENGLHDISFVMKKGTTTAIVGSTGSGKTTISRLLFRLYDVTGGALSIHGLDVRMLSQKSLRRSLGVVPQVTSLFNDTLRNNVLYGNRSATQEDLDRVAKEAQLDTFIGSLYQGWDTLVGDRGLKLSGGERQRLAIARCLLKDPPIVVLDEATSALDTITENSVQMALNKLGSERTCLVIAHRLGTVRNADNIVVIDGGRVVEQGTHEELMNKNGQYAEMWNMQVDSTDRSASTSTLDDQASS